MAQAGSRRGRFSPPAFSIALASLLGTLAAADPQSQPAASRPFAPGVAIDWPRREVRVDATVVLRRGPLEFLACFPGKEHESIVRFEASAEHLYQALGLIGLAPGRATTQPAGAQLGDLIEIEFERPPEGAARRDAARDWLRAVEYGRPPASLHFVFLGSTALPDRTLTAGRTGEGVALVDFPDALIGVTRPASSRSGDLWLEVNSERVPPVGTRVVLVLRAARPAGLHVQIDFRGAIRVNDAAVNAAELADMVLAERRLNPALHLSVRFEGALDADVEQLRTRLTSHGVPAEALEFVR
jgi:hypothetical protein